jgi:hypothetical protein
MLCCYHYTVGSGRLSRSMATERRGSACFGNPRGCACAIAPKCPARSSWGLRGSVFQPRGLLRRCGEGPLMTGARRRRGPADSGLVSMSEFALQGAGRRQWRGVAWCVPRHHRVQPQGSRGLPRPRARPGPNLDEVPGPSASDRRSRPRRLADLRRAAQSDDRHGRAGGHNPPRRPTLRSRPIAPTPRRHTRHDCLFIR